MRGFACHLLYSRRGALLPHLFTLTLLTPVETGSGGGIFSVPLVLQVALTGRYPAHCPVEFGLSSPGFPAAIVWPTATVVVYSKSLETAAMGAPRSLGYQSPSRTYAPRT